MVTSTTEPVEDTFDEVLALERESEPPPPETLNDPTYKFDLSMSFPERIVRAVARYRKKRKWKSRLHCQLFISYMKLGEIDIGKKDFIPQDNKNDALEDYIDETAEDEDTLVDRQAKHIINPALSKKERELRRAEYAELGAVAMLQQYEDEMIVDFVGCVRQFLSTYLLRDSFYYHIDTFTEAPSVVRSFLEWLLDYNVCPEYMADIRTSLMVCHRAKIELVRCKRAISHMPGRFNVLCAAKYGGQMYDAYGGSEDGGASWTDAETQQVFGLTKEQIRMAIDDVYGSLKVVKKMDTLMEVIHVEPFKPGELQSSEADERYKTSGLPPVLVPHGKVWLRRHNPFGHRPGEPWQLSQRSTGETTETNGEDAIIRLHLDPAAANELLPGMVMNAEFYKLENGLWYINILNNLWPSYYLDAQPDPYEDDSDEELAELMRG